MLHPKGKTPSRSGNLRKGVLFSAYGPSAIRQATCKCSRTLHSLRRTEQKKKYTPLGNTPLPVDSGGLGRKTIITYNSPKRYRRCQEPDFPTEERLRLRTTSQSASQTAPLVGEPLAKPFTLRGLPKPPLGRGGGTASAVTERLSPAAAHGRACKLSVQCLTFWENGI